MVEIDEKNEQRRGQLKKFEATSGEMGREMIEKDRYKDGSRDQKQSLQGEEGEKIKREGEDEHHLQISHADLLISNREFPDFASNMSLKDQMKNLDYIDESEMATSKK